MRATIRQTRVVQKANPQFAWSKRSSLWSNLPKEWGRPTTVHCTSGRNYGWRGFSRRSIGQWSGGRTDWKKFEMDPCTELQQSQIFWRHSRSGCCWLMSIMRNGFAGSGCRCFQRNVQTKFKRWGEREGEATSDRRQFWENAWATKGEVTSLSCQIQPSRLWFTGFWMARIWF